MQECSNELRFASPQAARERRHGDGTRAQCGAPLRENYCKASAPRTAGPAELSPSAHHISTSASARHGSTPPTEFSPPPAAGSTTSLQLNAHAPDRCIQSNGNGYGHDAGIFCISNWDTNQSPAGASGQLLDITFENLLQENNCPPVLLQEIVYSPRP